MTVSAGPASVPPIGLFVGLTTMDVLHRADRRPGADEKVTATRQDVAAGGPAANAAVTFTALGGNARLLSALGEHGAAPVARDDLVAHGVQIYDAAAPDYQLAVSAVLIDDATGERSVVSADAALSEVPPPARLPLDDVGVIMLDGHHPALARATAQAVRAVPAVQRPLVALDCGRWRPVFTELLPLADVAALSAAFRMPGVDEAATARAVLDAGARAVVITDGGRPARWWTNRASGSVAVETTVVRDTLGAGDAFHGALSAALVAGDDVATAAARACQVASGRVSHEGPRSWLTRLEPWWPAPT